MIRLRVIDSRQMQAGDGCLVFRQMADPATGRCIDVAVIVEYKDKHFEPWTEAKVFVQKLSVVPKEKDDGKQRDENSLPGADDSGEDSDDSDQGGGTGPVDGDPQRV